MVVAAEDDAAHPVRLDVHDHAPLPVRELHELAVHDVGHAVEPADAVGDADDPAHLEHVDADVEALHSGKKALVHGIRVVLGDGAVVELLPDAVELVRDGGVVDRVPDAELQAADELGVLLHPEADLPAGRADHLRGPGPDLLYKGLRERVGGGKRHIELPAAREVRHISGRQPDAGQNGVHRLRLSHADLLEIRLGGEVRLRPLHDMGDELHPGLQQHFAALIGAVLLEQRVHLPEGGLPGLARPGDLRAQRGRGGLRGGQGRQLDGGLRLGELRVDPLPAGAEDVHDGLPAREINDRREDRDIYEYIDEMHSVEPVLFRCGRLRRPPWSPRPGRAPR